MEEFSQSRGDDDLFDDEIVPIESSTTEPVQAVTQSFEQISPNPLKETSYTQSAPPVHTQRGRGRGRGGPTRGAPSRGRGLADSRFAPKDPPVSHADTTTQNKAITEPSADLTPTSDPANSINTATAPAVKPRPLAVRGDRSSTGGFQKPKLSESELTAKLAAARLKSQETAAAHARAQADKESFDEREKVARERRENEEKRRKELEGERESNRRRKMAGHQGREWDREKVEGQSLQGRSRWEERARERERYRGEQEDLSEYVWDEGRGRGRGEGEGGAEGGVKEGQGEDLLMVRMGMRDWM